ncbi:MAG: YeiH family protein [Akkermansiaceae bacterium]
MSESHIKLKPANQSKTLYEMIETEELLSLDSMEGSPTVNLIDISPPQSIRGSKWQLLPGCTLALTITILAAIISKLPYAPFTIEGATLKHPLGVSVLSIILGMLAASFWKMPSRIKTGCRWIAAWFIPIAIVCLGSRMDLSILSKLSLPLVGIVITIMIIAVILALLVGKMLGLSTKASYLLGVGSAVCGSSAILAVAPVSKSNESDVALAVGTVNLIGLIAMLGCVSLIWYQPDISAELYGALSGSTIHAVPQVVAAAESHGADASSIASAIKLMRVSLLVPVVLLSVFFFAKNKTLATSTNKKSLYSYIPWFVWAFVIMAILASNNFIPNLLFPHHTEEVFYDSVNGLTFLSKWLLAISMAAIGLQVNIKALFTSGSKALLCGLIVWTGMALSAYLLLKLYFTSLT